VASDRAAEAEPFVRVLTDSKAAPFALADFFMLQRRPNDAIAELQQRRQEERTAIEATHRLAQAHALRGDFAQAHRIVNELLAADGRNAEALLLQGQLYAQEGKREEALKTLKSAMGIDPNSARLQFALGRLYAATGDLEQAKQAYTEVLRLNPRATGAQIELARLNLLGGKVDASLGLARDAVRNEPGNLEAQVALVRSLVASGDIIGAERLIQPLVAANPSVATLHVQRGLVYAAQKNAVAARQSFEKALSLDPDSADALGGLVALDTAAGQFAAATERIEQRLRSQSPRPELLLLAARTAAAARDLAGAERHLRKAVQADPTLLQGYTMLGQLYLMQGKLNEARTEFETLAARQSRAVVPLTMLGLIAQLQGDTAAAQRQFERAIDLEPRAPIAANNLAWIYAERGDRLDLALQLAQTAAEVLPKVPEVRDTLGWVHYKRGSPDRAVAAFQDAVSLAPKNATYHYHLGLALANQGQTADARQALDKALALGAAAGTFPYADDARKRLNDLREEGAGSR
jgi:tetratricopeptide (TPR) repeat protein